MRVLHIVSISTMTGPADPALHIACAQKRLLGYDVEIAFDTVREGDMQRRVVELDVPARLDLSLCTKGGVCRALHDYRRLKDAFFRYDVVHAHATHDHAVAALARGRKSPAKLVRSVYHARSLAPRLFRRAMFARTDAFLVVADAHKSLLVNAHPRVTPDRVWTVPGAVDPDVFSPARNGSALRATLGIPSTAIVVGMIARFQTGRRQEDLISAVARVRKATGKDVWLALIGKGETQGPIETAIESCSLTKFSRLYGFRDHDLPEAIASCDVTVLLQEGSDAGCRAVLQSLCMGVPVIGVDVPAIRDAIGGTPDDAKDDAMCGEIISRDDPDALAAALTRWITSPKEVRDRVADACRARALLRYTEHRRVERIHRIYETIGVKAL